MKCRKCRHHSSISQTKLEPSGALLSAVAHIGPSVAPTGSSFTTHPASKFFSTLLCSHRGPSSHHLSAGWEPQPPHWSPGFYPSRRPISCPPPHHGPSFLSRPLCAHCFLSPNAFLPDIFVAHSLPPSDLHSNSIFAAR